MGHSQIEFARFLIENGHVRPDGNWEVYHGFRKMSLPHLTHFASGFGFDKPEEVLVELVELTDRVERGCHVHYNTTAGVVMLGEDHGFENPGYLSQVYLKQDGSPGEWSPARPGRAVLIPPGTVHDFEPGGGKMYFLSVQNPKLYDPETGRDDFHLIEPDVHPYSGWDDGLGKTVQFLWANAAPVAEHVLARRSLVLVP